MSLSSAPLPSLEPANAVWGTARVPWVRPRKLASRVVCSALFLGLVVGFIALGAYQYNSPLQGVTPAGIGCNWLFVNNASATFTSCGVDNVECLAPVAAQWELARCPGACLVDWPSPVLGSGNYTGTSRICAAAIHAGAVSAGRGGCFYYRLGGAQASFGGGESNGVRSAPFGWYPLSLEFRTAEGGTACSDGVIYTNIYVLAVGAGWVLLARPPAAWLVAASLTAGWFYLVFSTTARETLVVMLTSYSPRLVTALLLAAFLWRPALRVTVPEPSRLPLDALLFFALPFWCGINMDVVTRSGLDLSFAKGGVANAGLIAGLVIFVAVATPLVLAQAVLLHRAGLLKRVLLLALAVLLVVLIMVAAFHSQLSLHLHHWMVGAVAAAIFIGQPRCRFSIIVQALMLGVMANGITVWNIAPLFSPGGGGGGGAGAQSSPLVFWTGLNVSATTVSLQWATADVVNGLWKCNATVKAAARASAAALVGGGHSGAGPDADADADDSEGWALALPLTSSARLRGLQQISANDTDTVGPELPSPLDPSFRLSANAVLLLDALEPTSTTYTFATDLRLAASTFMFALSAKLPTGAESTTDYLYVTTLPPGQLSLGGGYYNGSDPTFANDPCARLLALNDLGNSTAENE